MISVKGVSVDPQKIEKNCELKTTYECDRDTKFSRFSRVLSEGC